MWPRFLLLHVTYSICSCHQELPSIPTMADWKGVCLKQLHVQNVRNGQTAACSQCIVDSRSSYIGNYITSSSFLCVVLCHCISFQYMALKTAIYITHCSVFSLKTCIFKSSLIGPDKVVRSIMPDKVKLIFATFLLKYCDDS